MKGCYVVTRHICLGILNGPATGDAMANVVIDGYSTIVNLSKFIPARFIGSGVRRRYRVDTEQIQLLQIVYVVSIFIATMITIT